MTPLPELLTVDQLAAELGQTRRWVYRQVEERGLPCYRLGRSLTFSRVEVRAWLEAHRAGVQEETHVLSLT